MSYYDKRVIDPETNSYQEKFLEYAHNWEDDESKEKKRIKILHAPDKNEDISFESKINSYIERNCTKISIIDIKYQKTSVLIIYEPK
tara:strand:- start:422 stop:682 length:261 start_codon:yes stop_codon:yes gene_type:complete